jgi:hypothetical protein
MLAAIGSVLGTLLVILVVGDLVLGAFKKGDYSTLTRMASATQPRSAVASADSPTGRCAHGSGRP